MTVILDLDGTLIDSSERMYRLFCELVPEYTGSKTEYWETKRDRVNHRELLARECPDVSFEEFNKVWLDKIELSEYLSMDTLFDDTVPFLERCRRRGDMVILFTARQDPGALREELNRLGIAGYFDEILCTGRGKTKKQLLDENRELLPAGSRYISDMGSDIALGNESGFLTTAITRGFMNGERLREYNPESITENLTQL